MNITDVLDQIGSDVLTADTKKALAEAFTEAVEKRIAEQSELTATDALQRLDEEHAKQLEQLLETIDKDHTEKLHSVIAKIDEDHTEKLSFLVKKYEKILKEDASSFKSQLVKQMSNYLDLYLEDAIPKKEITEAVSNKQAQKTVNAIKELIALDDEFINDTIREAVADGKKQIDTLKEQLNESVKQNIRVSQGAKAVKAELMLEHSTQGFSKEKKAYCMRVLKDKDPEYITENLKYVIKMFEGADASNRDLVTEQAMKKSTVVSSKVDTPKVVTESATITESTDLNDESVSEYLGALKNQDRA